MKSIVALVMFAAVAAANYHGGWNQWNGHDGSQKWHGPIALPPGYDKNGAPLPVQDTPEVAAAKAAQISVLARSGGSVPSGHGGWAGGWNGAHGGWAGAPGAWAGANGGWAGAHGGWAGANGGWAGAHGGWAGAPAAHGAWAAAPGNNNPLWNVHALPAGIHG